MKKILIDELGRNTKLLRIHRGLTMEQLGKLTGFSKSFISLVESGERRVSDDGLERIAQVLDVSREDLVTKIVDFKFVNPTNQK